MNIKLIIFIACVLIYSGFAINNSASLSESYVNPEYQTYIEEYRKRTQDLVGQSMNESGMGMEYFPSASGGTASNFEGPQVLLRGIRFHNEFLDKENERLKHIDGVSAHFDPDHTYFGLPDVKVSVKDVRLYDPDKGRLEEFLGFNGNDKPKPYKVYKKTLVSDSTNLKKIFEMQLWLTEFDVTVDIRPDSDVPGFIRQEDMDNLEYPGFWYGLQKKSIKLRDIPREHKDQRYGNLSFIIEVIPNQSPIYVHGNKVKTSKADFAIGAIYCTKAIIGNEENVQRINSNIHSGQPVFLNNEFDFDKMNQNPGTVAGTIQANVDKIIEAEDPNSVFIWNKPYYIKLHFNNLGTWRSGLFSQNQFHDQVTYSFLMPVFVVGSWDVIAPQEVLPEWNPPDPFIRKITLKNLLPFWHLGVLGKAGSILIIAIIMIFGLPLLIPGIGTVFRKVL